MLTEQEVAIHTHVVMHHAFSELIENQLAQIKAATLMEVYEETPPSDPRWDEVEAFVMTAEGALVGDMSSVMTSLILSRLPQAVKENPIDGPTPERLALAQAFEALEWANLAFDFVNGVLETSLDAAGASRARLVTATGKEAADELWRAVNTCMTAILKH